MKDRNEFSRKALDRQHNISPHTIVTNSALFQGRIFRGTFQRTPVTRAGTLVLGIFFLGLGASFLVGVLTDLVRPIEIDSVSLYGLLVSLVFIVGGSWLGIRLILIAVNRRKTSHSYRR